MDEALSGGITSPATVPKIIWLLSICGFLNIGGLSFLWPVNSIYIHTDLHKSMALAGLILMIYSGAGLFGSFLGGWLYDRVGAFSVLLGSLIVSAVCILLPAFTPNFAVYVAVMAVFGTTSAMFFPVMSAVAGHAWPSGGRRAFNFLYVSNNLGVAAGTALGGALAAWSFHAVFYGIAICYVGVIGVLCFLLKQPLRDIHDGIRSKSMTDLQPFVTPLPWGGLMILFSAYVLAWAVYVQWQATVSVYMQATGYSLGLYSLLWTMNGLLIFAGQPLVSFVTRRVSSLAFHMVGGTALFGLSFIVLLDAHHYSVYVFAMVLTTLGEIFVWPAVPAAVAQIAPANRLGLLQGVVGSCATGGRMVGPILGGILYDHGALHLVLLAAIWVTLLPVILFALYSRISRPSAGV